jgi:hypothetical protein
MYLGSRCFRRLDFLLLISIFIEYRHERKRHPQSYDTPLLGFEHTSWRRTLRLTERDGKQAMLAREAESKLQGL